MNLYLVSRYEDFGETRAIVLATSEENAKEIFIFKFAGVEKESLKVKKLPFSRPGLVHIWGTGY